jgi:SNF2 family DNA or RNA helicase
VLKICYDNKSLKDIYEWMEVDYVKTFPNDLPKIPAIKSYPLLTAEVNQTWDGLRVNDSKINGSKFIRLYQFPRLQRNVLAEILRSKRAWVHYGNPEFLFEVNVNKLFGATENLNRYSAQKIERLAAKVCGDMNMNLELIQPYIDILLRGVPYECPSTLPSVIGNEEMPELDINLYEYQKENIRWILHMERNAPYKVEYTPAIHMGSRWVNPVDQAVMEDKPDSKVLEFNGGVVLDQVGLGKTITLLVASMLNSADDSVGTPDKEFNIQIKIPCHAVIQSKGSKRFGQICGRSTTNPSKLCKTHDKSDPAASAVPPISQYMNQIYDAEKHLFKSRATLIVCPNQLPSHWLGQFDHFAERWDIKILRMLSAHDQKSITYKDVINADFIITTFDLVCKPSRHSPNDTVKDPLKTGQITEQHLTCNNVYLNDFHWRRIIVDEIHEVELEKFKNSQLKPFLCGISSDYKWCLSGSAFINDLNSYKFMLDYLYSKFDAKDYEQSYLFLKSYHHKRIVNNCFRCNTKESTNSETNHIPPITNHYAWLSLHPVEYALYTTRLATKNSRVPMMDECLQQICCHPALSTEFKEQTRKTLNNDDDDDDDSLTLKKIKSKMVRYVEEQITSCKSNLKFVEEDLKFYYKELAWAQKCNSEERIEQYSQDVKRCKTTRTRETKLLRKLEQALELYTPPPAVEKGEEELVVDLDEESIQLHGTKVSYLLEFLKKDIALNPTDQYIIFSQWESFISKMSAILKIHGISSYSCKGNVFQKRKAIRSFKSDDTTSSKNGDDCKVFIITQAIGRAVRLGQSKPIEVYHIMMKDTIEEEAYNILQSEDSDVDLNRILYGSDDSDDDEVGQQVKVI